MENIALQAAASGSGRRLGRFGGRSKVHRLFFRILGCATFALITVLALIPGDNQLRTVAPKEFEHFAAYLFIAGALGLGFPTFKGRLMIGIWLVLGGGALEVLQNVVPGRVPHLADFLAGAAGVVAGLLASRAISPPARPMVRPW